MSTITHKRLVSAMTKSGCTVQNRKRFDNDDAPSKTWVATNPKNGRSLEWYVQAGFVPAKDGKPASWDESNLVTTYIVQRSPHTDAMTDCYCDNYFHSIRAAIAEITR